METQGKVILKRFSSLVSRKICGFFVTALTLKCESKSLYRERQGKKRILAWPSLVIMTFAAFDVAVADAGGVRRVQDIGDALLVHLFGHHWQFEPLGPAQHSKHAAGSDSRISQEAMQVVDARDWLAIERDDHIAFA
jgi:hypothetical protein